MLQYFTKNRAILSKNWGQKKNCQNPFPAILRLKKFFLKVLWPELFLQLPLLASTTKINGFTKYPPYFFEEAMSIEFFLKILVVGPLPRPLTLKGIWAPQL